MKTIKKFAITCLIVVAGLMSSCSIFADEVPLGTFFGETYFYDDAAVVKEGAVVNAWVISHSQTFNLTHVPEYSRAAGLFVINCQDGTAQFIASIIFDKDDAVLNKYVVPDNDRRVIPLQYHTPAYALAKRLCFEAPKI